MPEIKRFEIYAEDVERAMSFYKSVFGWIAEKRDGKNYYFIKTKKGPGLDGSIKKREAPIQGESIVAYVCTIAVDSIDDCLKEIESCGGIIVNKKTEIVGGGYRAYFRDTEGNIVGLTTY